MRYLLTVRETIERQVSVDADSPREARRASRSEWGDVGDRGTVVDYSVEDVDGPETETEPDPCSEWKARCEA